MIKDHGIKTSQFVLPLTSPCIICYTSGAMKDFNAAGFKV